MDLSTTLMQRIAGFVCICLVQRCQPQMIATCPVGLASSYYIADSENPCVFYWCLGSVVISMRYCAQGSAVPAFYQGLGNPCVTRNDLCEGPEWSYHGSNGPAAWPALFAECSGRRQSPVDISGAVPDPALLQPGFSFMNYNVPATDWELENVGESVKVTLGELIAGISGGGLDGDYTAYQFHFHWGAESSRGSEHTVNGQTYPIEGHIVHYKTSYGSLEEAAEFSDGFAVLGVFFRLSADDNPALKPLIDGLAGVINYNDDASVPLSTLTLFDLLPSNRQNFYRYLGSLTTPECNEVVIWTLFADTVDISESQLAAFRRLQDGNEEAIEDNFRPTQPLFGRTITTSC